MNIKIARGFQFSCMVLGEASEQAQINTYTLALDMTVLSHTSAHYNIAYDRIKFWIMDIMQDSVLISQNHTQLSQWQSTGNRCIVFPQDPVDQIVGAMMFTKLNSITEQNLEINGLSISSAFDDDICYLFEAGEVYDIPDMPAWWTDGRPMFTAIDTHRTGTKKVINLSRARDWKTHGLDWDAQEKSSSAIVTSFVKDEEK